MSRIIDNRDMVFISHRLDSFYITSITKYVYGHNSHRMTRNFFFYLLCVNI